MPICLLSLLGGLSPGGLSVKVENTVPSTWEVRPWSHCSVGDFVLYNGLQKSL